MEIRYKHLKNIMKEMCSRVGADYDTINFSEPGWFDKYEWTKQEYDDFVDWLSDYLIKNKEARISILNTDSPSKKLITNSCKLFGLNYGWKFKE